jgi:ketosteroid isomerase-like protein
MKNINQMYLVFMMFLTMFSSSAFSHGDGNQQSKSEMFTGLQTDAAKVVIAFQHALETGDAKAARDLLADNVLILEGKGVDRSAEEYASHHMLSDMKYLKAMTIEKIEHHVSQSDAVALSVSRSTVKGTYKDKEINRQGNETMSLEKRNGEWKITHIHWSN